MPTITGMVYDEDGQPAPGRIVRAYRRDTGALLDSVETGGGESVPVDPDYNNVSLLLHMDGANGSTVFTDVSPVPKVVTRFGDAQISTAQSVFGGASGYFDGTGDYLTIPGGDDFAFGTGDFTFECWFRPAVLTVAYIFSLGDWGVYTGTNGQILIWGGSSNLISSAVSVISAGNWYHVAITRSVTSLRMFVNGVQRGSTVTNSTSFTNAQNVGIAIRPASGTDFLLNGYIDDLRVTKGVARYTENFTPPTRSGFSVDVNTLPPGQYQIDTSYTGECQVVCLDDTPGTVYNDLIKRTYPN